MSSSGCVRKLSQDVAGARMEERWQIAEGSYVLTLSESRLFGDTAGCSKKFKGVRTCLMTDVAFVPCCGVCLTEFTSS